MLELGDLHLAELLDFRPAQGIIRLHEAVQAGVPPAYRIRGAGAG